jgi:two-component system, OmpR family, response regulator
MKLLPAMSIAESSPVVGAARPADLTTAASLVLFIGRALQPDGALSELLRRTGVRTMWIASIEQAFRTRDDIAFDAAVVENRELEPPEALRVAQLRQRLRCPMLVVVTGAASPTDVHDEVAALEQGADDYIGGPIPPRRLRARVLALLRRGAPLVVDTPPQAGTPVGALPVVGGWTLDPIQRELRRPGCVVSFTKVLGALLQEFFEAPQRVLSREHLRRRIQGLGSQATVETMNTHVHRLRRYLQAQRVVGLRIDTVRGQGYALRGSATAIAREQPLLVAERTHTSDATGAAFA